MFKIFKKTMRISELMDYYRFEKLNMSPYYQRSGKVWSISKKQNLIDSIFNEIDLPKFYFHFHPMDEEERYDYAVIDGKQRILAIMDFLNNKIKLKKDFVFLDNRNCIYIGGLSYEEIQERYPYIAAQFLMFELDIVFVDSDEIDRINEMFIRINAGVPVNNAEKRNAAGGKLMRLINTICNQHPFFNETVCFSNKRNIYQEIFLKLFVLEYKNEIVSLNNTMIESVLFECKQCERDEEKIVHRVEKGLYIMNYILGDKCKYLKNNNIVTYYYFLKDKEEEEPAILSEFVKVFENKRKKIDEGDENLIDYWQYNQLARQGTYQKYSIERRIEILEKVYTKFASNM